MATNWSQATPEVDWETLIMEAQTAPAETLQTAQEALYLEIFPWVDEMATRFAQQKGIDESDVGRLFDLGIAQVLAKIDQFTQLTEDPLALTRKFKRWIKTVCQNRWIDEYRKICRDYERYQSDGAALTEDHSKHWDNEIHPRSEDDWRCITAAYERCLSRFSEPYQNAITETEALRLEQGTPESARGRAGEAAAIAAKHGVNPSTVRKYRERLKQCIRDEYAKDAKP